MRGLGAPPATEPEFSDKPHRRTERRNRGFAKSMRRNPTEAERQFWLLLKDRRFSGFKFRRQVPIGPYIADFVCYSARLIVELDGSQHAENPRDTQRDTELTTRGFTLLRVWNTDLATSPGAVADAVWHTLTEIAHGPQ